MPILARDAKRGGYRIYTDGIFGGIQHDPWAQPDGEEVFTFTEAKKALARKFTERADEYRDQAKWARSLTLADVEDPCDD